MFGKTKFDNSGDGQNSERQRLLNRVTTQATDTPTPRKCPKLCPYTDVDRGWAWVALAAGFLANTIMGAQYCSVNIFYAQFLEVFGKSRAETSWFGSLNSIVLYSSGSLGSFLLPIIGIRYMFFIAAVAASMSFVTIYLSHSLLLNTIVYGLVGGLGYGFVLTSVVAVNARYFKRYIYQATSVSFVGGGLGTLIYGPLLEYLFHHYGWRGAALIFAGISLNLCVVGCAVFPQQRPVSPSTNWRRSSIEPVIYDKPLKQLPYETIKKLDEALLHIDVLNIRQEYQAATTLGHSIVSEITTQPTQYEPMDTTVATTSKVCETLSSDNPMCPLLGPRQAPYGSITHPLIDTVAGPSSQPEPEAVNPGCRIRLADPDFYLLSLLAFTWGFGGITFLTVFKDMTASSGMPDIFGTAVLLFGAGNITTRVLISVMSFKTAILQLSLVLLAGSVIFGLFSAATVPWSFLTLCWLAGMFLGFTFVMLPVSVGIVYGREEMAVTYGYVLLSVGLSNAMGPPLVGFLRDTTGSYVSGLCAISFSTMIASVATLILYIRVLRKEARKSVPTFGVCQT